MILFNFIFFSRKTDVHEKCDQWWEKAAQHRQEGALPRLQRRPRKDTTAVQVWYHASLFAI